jgi:hypothetical protein
MEHVMEMERREQLRHGCHQTIREITTQPLTKKRFSLPCRVDYGIESAVLANNLLLNTL